MKKKYESPIAEIEEFTFENAITTSGWGEGGEGSEMPEEF